MYCAIRQGSLEAGKAAGCRAGLLDRTVAELTGEERRPDALQHSTKPAPLLTTWRACVSTHVEKKAVSCLLSFTSTGPTSLVRGEKGNLTHFYGRCLFPV